MAATPRPLFDPQIVRRAIGDSFVKLAPRHMVRNPVMFVVLIGSVLTTLVLLRDAVGGRGNLGFTLQIAVWLWFTVLFANFAEAMAEGRGKAQADALRKSRTQAQAKRIPAADRKHDMVAVAADMTPRPSAPNVASASSATGLRLPARKHATAKIVLSTKHATPNPTATVSCV